MCRYVQLCESTITTKNITKKTFKWYDLFLLLFFLQFKRLWEWLLWHWIPLQKKKTCLLEVKIKRLPKLLLLTLIAHEQEGYSSRPVCLSVCLSVTLWFWRILTINSWFRYEITQDEDLRPFIVLLFFYFGLIVEKTRSFQLRGMYQHLWAIPPSVTS